MIQTIPQRDLQPPDRVSTGSPPAQSGLRQFVTLLLIVVAFGQAASCASDSDRSKAFQGYMQQVTSWAPVEAETARSIQRIFASQFVDEAAVRQEVSQTLPRIKNHLDRIESVAPADSQLREINLRYRLAWQQLQEALIGLPDAIGHSDAAALAASRASMTAWGQSMLDIAADLRRIRPDTPAPG